MNPALVKYINDLLSRGYSREQITQALLRAGYHKDIIDQYLYQLHPKHALFSIKIVMGIVLISVGILIAGFVYLNYYQKNNVMPVEISLSISQPEYQSGHVKFTATFSSLTKSKEKTTAGFSYFISNSDGETILRKSELISFETESSKSFAVDMPENIEDGAYTLNASLTYRGKSVSAIRTINVKSNQVKPIDKKQDGISNNPIQIQPVEDKSCDDLNVCTTDSLSENQCVHEQIIPCCGNSLCEKGEENICSKDCIQAKNLPTRDELFSKSRELSQSSPSEAAEYCRQLFIIKDRNNCFNEIAQASKNKKYCSMVDSTYSQERCIITLAKELSIPDYCDDMKTTQSRDSCYVDFILLGDYTLCDKLVDEHLRETCRLLG